MKQKEAVMKIRMQQIVSGEDEILIKYKKMTPEIKKLVERLSENEIIIVGKKEGRQYRILPKDIYYFESVDEKLFAYTSTAEYQVLYTLGEVEEKLSSEGFFRCNKSFVVNINHIVSVKSEMGNRIDALMDNEEHVIISRRYAKTFREMLRKEEKNE